MNRMHGDYTICRGTSGSGWGDWYDADYYGTSPALDPAGPDSGVIRVLRGGSFLTGSHYCRSGGSLRVRSGPPSQRQWFSYCSPSFGTLISGASDLLGKWGGAQKDSKYESWAKWIVYFGQEHPPLEQLTRVGFFKKIH